MEKIEGAGKIWHKGCFKCAKCAATLNLKTFKAFDGKVWCKVHYPPEQTKVQQFGNDKKSDSGTYENAATESQTDAGGQWGGGSADTGEYSNTPGTHDAGAEGGYAAEGGEQGYADPAAGGEAGGYDEGY